MDFESSVARGSGYRHLGNLELRSFFRRSLRVHRHAPNKSMKTAGLVRISSWGHPRKAFFPSLRITGPCLPATTRVLRCLHRRRTNRVAGRSTLIPRRSPLLKRHVCRPRSLPRPFARKPRFVYQVRITRRLRWSWSLISGGTLPRLSV